MSRVVMAIYIPLRIFLLLFVIGAMIRGEWWLAFDAWLFRSAIWWIALPERRNSKTGLTIGEHMRKEARKMAREHGFADIGLTLARMPSYVAIPCRLMLFVPARWMAHDQTFSTLITYGKGSGKALSRIVVYGDDDERESAARALAELKPKGYEEALRPLLGDRSDAVRAVAEGALGVAENEASSDPLLRVVRLAEGEPFPGDLVSALRSTFEISSAGERRVVIRELGEHGGPEAIDWLIELVAANRVESSMAIRAVERIDDPRIADALLTQINTVRSTSALLQLAKRGDVRIESIVLEKLDRSGGRLMKGIYFSALAQLPSPSAREALELRVRQGGATERLLAAEALAHYRGDAGPLRAMAGSWNPAVRWFARKSLARQERTRSV